MQHLCHLCSVIFNMLLDFGFKELGSNIALISFMQCTLLTCFCAMIFCIIEFSTNKALMLFLYCIFSLSCLNCDNVKTFGLTDCLPGNKPRVSENTHSLGLQVATKGLHKLEKGQHQHCLLVLHQIINCLLVHIINIPETKFLKIPYFWLIYGLGGGGGGGGYTNFQEDKKTSIFIYISEIKKNLLYKPIKFHENYQTTLLFVCLALLS